MNVEIALMLLLLSATFSVIMSLYPLVMPLGIGSCKCTNLID